MESDQNVPDADTKNHKASPRAMKESGADVVVLMGAGIQYLFLYQLANLF